MKYSHCLNKQYKVYCYYVFPVYGITDTIMKSAVKAVDILLLAVPPIIPVNPILTICGELKYALVTE